jgi:hypothetical protein
VQLSTSLSRLSAFVFEKVHEPLGFGLGQYQSTLLWV